MMIVDDEMTPIRFEKLRPGDVYMCPQSREWFMKVVTVADDASYPLNTVRLSDGNLFDRAENLKVDFYRSARLVVSS